MSKSSKKTLKTVTVVAPRRKRRVKKTSGLKKKNAKTVSTARLVAAPTASTRLVVNAKPQFKSLPNGDCRIIHREYCYDLKSSATTLAFGITTAPINPGLSAVFPWLSGIAINYESYRFNSLRIRFESEAATSIGGSVFMAIDFDSTDVPPTNKQALMTFRNAVRTAPWTSVSMNCSKEDINKRKTYYVRADAVGDSEDIRLYDIGNLFAGSQGVSGSSVTLGEIYVEYDITLMTPTTYTTLALRNNSIIGGRFSGTGVGTPSLPLHDPVVSDPNNYGVHFDSKNSYFTLDYKGYYYLTMWCGAGLSTGVPHIEWIAGAGVLTRIETQTGGSGSMDVWSIIADNDNSVIVYYMSSGSPTSVAVLISRVPDGLYNAPEPPSEQKESKRKDSIDGDYVSLPQSASSSQSSRAKVTPSKSKK